MKDRPDEPGIWTREGKFYRVWENPGSPEFFGDEILPNGTLGDYLDFSTMPGNWHKLTAPATNAEAREKFHGWLKGHCNQSSDEQIADKAAEIFTGVEYVPIEKYRIAVKQIEDLETQVHHISDRRILAITTNWPATNNRRAELIERKVARTITPDETAELSRLQSYASARQNLFGPLPTEELEAQLVDLQAAEITTLKATVEKLEEQVATEHAKYINSERAATVALQAQTILKQAEEIAELKRDKANFENGCDHLAEDVKKLSFQLNEAKDSAAAWESTASFAAEKIAEMRKPPTVIEGKGQAVTEEQAGWYWAEGSKGTVAYMHIVAGSAFAQDCRYIKAIPPTFPPRKPAFVAPPKPEQPQNLYRIKQGNDKGTSYWGFPATEMAKGQGAELLIAGGLRFYNFSWCEEIDQATGEPIKEPA